MSRHIDPRQPYEWVGRHISVAVPAVISEHYNKDVRVKNVGLPKGVYNIVVDAGDALRVRRTGNDSWRNSCVCRVNWGPSTGEEAIFLKTDPDFQYPPPVAATHVFETRLIVRPMDSKRVDLACGDSVSCGVLLTKSLFSMLVSVAKAFKTLRGVLVNSGILAVVTTAILFAVPESRHWVEPAIMSLVIFIMACWLIHSWKDRKDTLRKNLETLLPGVHFKV